MERDADRYIVPAREGRHHFTDKGSKFIAVAAPAEHVDEAEALLEAEQRHYHDATHHCYAWVVEDEEKSADAGEPSGTAGRPILDAIKGSGLQNVAVVVTRYFGGTKLGTGGLVRAYGQAAREALAAAGAVEKFRTAVVNVSFDHADTSPVHHTASRFDARQVGAAYGERVAMRFELRASRAEDFRAAIREATHGRAETDVASI